MIDKLDLRRPQVYIEAKIVAISDSTNFRLAVEVQQIIGQFALRHQLRPGLRTRRPTTSCPQDRR